MAKIIFYDTTELDKQALQDGFKDTDHNCIYIPDHIGLENLDADAEVISVFVSSSVTSEMIERLPKLKIIACRSTGFNNIDLAAAEAHGVTVVNVPSYGERTVAEYTFALLLTLTRRITQAASNVDLTEQPHLMGMDLFGKTIGVVGTGRIGANVVRIAKGFGMDVLAYDPYPNAALQQELGYAYVDLQELLARSDVVTLHVPFTGSNKYLINQEAFATMKDGVVFINTSRGELVDTIALIGALQSGKVSMAGLDVLEEEHIMSLHGELELLQDGPGAMQASRHGLELLALQKIPNVLLTPHNAFNTAEALGRINQTTVDNIVQFWYGNVPHKVVASQQTGKLLIIRHTESEWNAEGKWTGTRDVHLSEKGFADAAKLGQILPPMHLDQAFASHQIRTLETLEAILDTSHNFDVPIERIVELNERDYGDETGLNKWDVEKKLGEEVFNHMRRDWDYPIPGGETLKQVYDRAFPFYRDRVVPLLQAGKNVLVVAHGNSIRALMHYIEQVPEDDMAMVEMLFSTIVEYTVDKDGKMVSKQLHIINTPKPPA